MSARYRPGGWHAAVTPQGLALLPPELSLVLVEGIWGRLAGGGGLGGVLEALTGAFGTSLSSIPSFAVIAVADGEVRLAVRGPLSVSVQTVDASTIEVSGLGVTTWSERLMTEVASVEVAVDGSAAGGSWYPLVEGIVAASELRLTLAAVPSAPVPSLGSLTAGLATANVLETETETETEQGTEQEFPPGDVEPVEADDAPDAEPTPPGAESRVSETTLSGTALIDSIPSLLREPDDEYDHLWGATVVKPVSEAAVRPPETADDEPAAESAHPPAQAVAPAPTEPLPAVPAAGDHDGETITFAHLQALRGQPAPGADAAAAMDAPPPAPSAEHGWLELSTGERVELTSPVVIGRRPRAVRVSADVFPQLIAVPSPQHDISRSHIEIRTEGDVTLVVDLDTTNGTVLRRTGTAPVRLHPNDATILIDGDVIDLGDGVLVTVRGVR